MCDPSLTRAISERFRDEFLVIKHYAYLWLLYFTFTFGGKLVVVLRNCLLGECVVTQIHGCLTCVMNGDLLPRHGAW